MNFKRAFSFKAGCWLTACRLAKHSWEKEERGVQEALEGEEKEVLAKWVGTQAGWGIGCPSQWEIIGHSVWEASVGAFLTLPQDLKRIEWMCKTKKEKGGKNKEKVQKEKVRLAWLTVDMKVVSVVLPNFQHESKYTDFSKCVIIPASIRTITKIGDCAGTSGLATERYAYASLSSDTPMQLKFSV